MYDRVCWHQSLRGMVDGLSDFVAHSILCLRKGTLTARYSKIFLAFFFSGIFHIAWDHGAGIPMRESGAMQFFLTQAFGITLEDAFQAAYYWLSGKQRPSEAPFLHRLFGYIWLILFLTWSMPVWIFPTLRYTRVGVDILLPFTIFGSGVNR